MVWRFYCKKTNFNRKSKVLLLILKLISDIIVGEISHKMGYALKT